MERQQSNLVGTNDDLHSFFSPIKFSQFIFPNHCIFRHSSDKENHNARQCRSRTREYLKITCKTSATRIQSRLSATASNWLIATIGNLGNSENNADAGFKVVHHMKCHSCANSPLEAARSRCFSKIQCLHQQQHGHVNNVTNMTWNAALMPRRRTIGH